MSLIYQIPRPALWWLLLAQGAVILPLMQYLPLWLIAVWAVCVGWRIQVVRGVFDAPKVMVKVPLALTMVVALVLSYGKLFALEPLVALLLLAFLLKLLELQSQRDVLLLLLLGFFVASTQLLFSTSIIAFLYAIISFTFLMAAFMALHTATATHSFWHSLKTSSVITLQAIPLALVLFFIMPRIGSLWTVPLSDGNAKTGFSDSMEPGNISQLSKDYSPAFRVDFTDKKAPVQSSLYWRGLSLSSFDGRRWELPFQDRDDNMRYRRIAQEQRKHNYGWQVEFASYRRKDNSPYIDYQVMMEASFQPWLFALTTASVGAKDVLSTPDYLFLSKRPVSQRFLYQARSYPEFKRQGQSLGPSERYQNTLLPSGSNPRATALAQQWREAGDSDRRVIANAMRLFQREFAYSLQDTLLSELNPVDDFLFSRKRGYCEHFASAFVVLMRAADIPARVVLGYQGGQWNEEEKYLLVSQADAHAWAEVWLPEQGWTRVDPTSAVAPERIELGFRDYIQQSSTANEQNGFAELRQSPLLMQLQMQLDAINYSWQSWVLSYDQDQQMIFFQKVLGGQEHWRIVAVLMGASTFMLALLALWLWWRARPEAPAAELVPWLELEKKLAAGGWIREPGETPQQFSSRVSRQRPDLEVLLERYTKMAYTLLYIPIGSDQHQQLLKDLAGLRNSIRL
ncbi:DUF3488 and transglutaminase-like domain-containing protein [uncultured Pseudoteredinibacter sp.]|uniref:transglutaminase TgpA family protein n=1 Tax=uncultured Pseudoteredinibacter sp. TaxID=1641701 RepID=UPI002607F370|nr:DUF3488 and transglutaminase-like domain-containing protein [uncultured Pseudoteredinibacter sp.]